MPGLTLYLLAQVSELWCIDVRVGCVCNNINAASVPINCSVVEAQAYTVISLAILDAAVHCHQMLYLWVACSLLPKTDVNSDVCSQLARDPTKAPNTRPQLCNLLLCQ